MKKKNDASENYTTLWGLNFPEKYYTFWLGAE
jgi:hypothetical protein